MPTKTPGQNEPATHTKADDGQYGVIRSAIHSITQLATLGRNQSVDNIAAPHQQPVGEHSTAPPLAAHLTDHDIRAAVHAELARSRGVMFGPDFVLAIEGNTVIFRDGERLFRQAFTVSDANVVTLVEDSKEEVQQDTRFISLGGAAADPGMVGNTQRNAPLPHQGDDAVKTDERVRALIAHQHTSWAEGDTALLATFSDEQLARLQLEADARQDTAPRAALASPDTPESPSDPALEPAAAPLTLDMVTHAVQAAVDAALSARLPMLGAQLTEQAERQQLVAHMTAHGYTDEELQPMATATMRKMISSLEPTSFSGMGFPAFAAHAGEEDGPPDDPDWS